MSNVMSCLKCFAARDIHHVQEAMGSRRQTKEDKTSVRHHCQPESNYFEQCLGSYEILPIDDDSRPETLTSNR